MSRASYPEAKMVASELVGAGRRQLFPEEHQTKKHWYARMNIFKTAYEGEVQKNTRLRQRIQVLQGELQTLAELKRLIRQWNDNGMPELSQEDLYALGVIS